SRSSEKRSMSLQPFESDVPPLNVRCSPMPVSVNNSRRVQQIQKSFSMLAARREMRSSAMRQASRLSSAGSWRKTSILFALGREAVKDRTDPGGREMRILRQRRLVLGLEVTAERRDHFLVHVPLSQPAQRLNHEPARAPRSRHVARRSALEHDFALSDLYATARAVGQEHDANGHLPGEPEHVCCV